MQYLKLETSNTKLLLQRFARTTTVAVAAAVVVVVVDLEVHQLLFVSVY
jgi:hypothetical protein